MMKMQPVNDLGQRVLKVLTEGLDKEGDERKVANSDVYMAVWVERIDRTDVFTVAHYFVQDHDSIADPEMSFILLDGTFYPTYYNQRSGAPREEWSVEWTTKWGKLFVTDCRTEMQADHASFADWWLKNIADQQNLHDQIAAKEK